MMQVFDLAKLLSEADRRASRQLGLFALLNLGIVDMLASGALSSEDAMRVFFNAKNCLYVREKLGNKVADQIMSHGAQLHDLFEALPAKEAKQEFQRELGSIRALCLRLLEQHKLVA